MTQNYTIKIEFNVRANDETEAKRHALNELKRRAERDKLHFDMKVFRETFTQGGLFFLDEMDATTPDALLMLAQKQTRQKTFILRKRIDGYIYIRQVLNKRYKASRSFKKVTRFNR